MASLLYECDLVHWDAIAFNVGQTTKRPSDAPARVSRQNSSGAIMLAPGSVAEADPRSIGMFISCYVAIRFAGMLHCFLSYYSFILCHTTSLQPK